MINNVFNSFIELCKDFQVSEQSLSSVSDSVAEEAGQKFFKSIGSPSCHYQAKFLSEISAQIPTHLSLSLYKFYFYQVKDISDPTDPTILIQLNQITQLADKAIHDYQECIKLMEKGMGREMFKFLPMSMLNYLYGLEFVKITVESDLNCQLEELIDLFISHMPETKLENFRLVIQKMRNIDLPFDLYAIDDCEQKARTIIPVEIFARVHHRAIEDIKRLFQHHTDNFLEKVLIARDLETIELFQKNTERVKSL
ncbi:hypothetical protein [Candidatus Protochlamydia sp. W-9]|uniref:hypothetical protein n=1 Tax=Candidatus Protochlamydia sp. W-9 TaxID=1785087 RepID=UPI00096A4C1A|nr:hypothetical protein [Candidatus Protochlamydia sp. W-9]